MRISSFAMWTLAIALTGLAACGDDGGPTTELTCANYCTSIMANCAAGNQQYANVGECMSTCNNFPVGTEADMAGNTLGCRTYHASAAETGADVHCRHAGPGGDAACGANCEGFCTLVLGACTGASAPYSDMNACMTACGGFATTPPYSSSQTSGNSFACRLYHATAASANPAVHCAHTGATSSTCN